MNEMQKKWMIRFFHNIRLRKRYLLHVVSILGIDSPSQKKQSLPTQIEQHLQAFGGDIRELLSLPGARFMAISDTLKYFDVLPAPTKEKMIEQVLGLYPDTKEHAKSVSDAETHESSLSRRSDRGAVLVERLMDDLL